MKHIHTTITSSLLIFSLIVLSTKPVAALQEPERPAAEYIRKPVLIAELKVFATDNTDADFIELYNPNEEAVDVTGWLVQYRTASALPEKAWVDKNASGKDVDTRARLGCGTGCAVTMQPKGRLLIASPSAKLEEADFVPAANLGLASTGGQVRLVSVDPLTKLQTQEDLLGYGKASSTGLPAATAEGTAVSVHGGGGSLKRVVAEGDRLVDTDDNAHDFELAEEPTPGLADVFIAPEPPREAPGPTGPDEATPEPSGLQLNEILPDPASPRQDTEDEFIELFNAGAEKVSLKGLMISTGTSKSQQYTFDDEAIVPAGEYYAVYAKDSALALTNAGATVTLTSSSGAPLDTTMYTGAKADRAWARNAQGAWQWTDTLTPGAVNAIELRATTAKVAKPAAKKEPAKKTPKTKTAKAPKPKKETTPKTTIETKPAAVKQDASVWVAGGMAMVTSGYLAYDYRASFRRLLERLTTAVRG